MPGLQIKKGTTYVDYPAPGTNQVTAANLNAHVDNAELLPGAISAQNESSPQGNDYILAARGAALFKYTINSIRDLLSTYFPLRSGSSMTGELILSSSVPSAANVAASKGYVDSTAAAAAAAATLPGAIVMWGGATIPTGWLECNGQSTAGYASLTAIYGTNLPDLRGEFIRGWDHGRGVDLGRAILSAQAQDIQPHTHTYVQTTQGTDTTSGGDTHYINASSGITGSTGTTETRPRNVALMFIVKT
jgi:microcystin-dependent protein